jgi:DnaJ-like protein
MSPYDILGVSPGADAATIRAAYRRLAKRYHPDHNPDDPTAAARMAAINAAYDTLTRSSIPGISAVRSSAGASPTTRMFVVLLVLAISGAGKTRALGKWLSGERIAHVVVGAPTIALVTEVAEWLQRYKVSVPVDVVHSEQGGDQSVSARIQRWFEHQQKKPASAGGILICTHAALLDLTPQPCAARFDLIFDEIPDCFSFVTRHLGRGYRWISRFVIGTPFRHGVMRLQSKDIGGPMYEMLAKIARNVSFDEVDAVFQELASAILDPYRWVLVLADQWHDLVRPHSPRTYGGELEVLTVLHPERFVCWKSITMMGARADRSVLHLLWTRLFDQRFAEHPFLQRGLPARHANGKRLTIRYFWPERATRTMLATTARGGGTMQAAMCRSVAAHFAWRPFLWSLPQPRHPGGVRDGFWRGGGSAFDPKLRLPGRSFGQNLWRAHTNVALLSVINLSREQLHLLECLGIDEAEVFDAMAATIAYQDLLQCNLRQANATASVECLVPDLPLALALAEEFPGSIVEQMPERMIPVPAGRRGPAPSGTAMSAAERKRRSRAAQRQRKEQERHFAREDA